MSQIPSTQTTPGLQEITPPQRVGGSRLLALGAVILIAGLTIGFAAGMTFGRSDLYRHLRHSSGISEFVARHITRDLSLTPDQARKVESIVKRRTERMRELRAATRPQVRAEVDLMWDEVSEVLTPEQRQKLQQRREMFERYRASRDQHEPGAGLHEHNSGAGPWSDGRPKRCGPDAKRQGDAPPRPEGTSADET